MVPVPFDSGSARPGPAAAVEAGLVSLGPSRPVPSPAPAPPPPLACPVTCDPAALVKGLISEMLMKWRLSLEVVAELPPSYPSGPGIWTYPGPRWAQQGSGTLHGTISNNTSRYLWSGVTRWIGFQWRASSSTRSPPFQAIVLPRCRPGGVSQGDAGSRCQATCRLRQPSRQAAQQAGGPAGSHAGSRSGDQRRPCRGHLGRLPLSPRCWRSIPRGLGAEQVDPTGLR